MPLRTIARCLRGMAMHVGFDFRLDGFLEGDVQILGRPVGMPGDLVAIFERANLELASEGLRRLVKRPRGGIMIGQNAAIGAERQRSQTMAEQPAVDFGQRQHAHDVAAALGQQKMGAVAERLFDHALPAGNGERTLPPGVR